MKLSYIGSLTDIAEKLSRNPSMSKAERQSILADLYVVLSDIRNDFILLQDVKKFEKKLTATNLDTLPVKILVHLITAFADAIAKVDSVFTKSDIVRATLIDRIIKMSDENVAKLAAYVSTLSES